MDHFCFFVISVRLYQTALSVSRNLVVTIWEKADLFALLYKMYSCVFDTFQNGDLGRCGT